MTYAKNTLLTRIGTRIYSHKLTWSARRGGHKIKHEPESLTVSNPLENSFLAMTKLAKFVPKWPPQSTSTET